MTTHYIARAFDGNRWVQRLEVDNLEEAVHLARDFMDILEGVNEAWLMIEVIAITEASTTPIRQWHGSHRGYRAVVGRNGKDAA